MPNVYICGKNIENNIYPNDHSFLSGSGNFFLTLLYSTGYYWQRLNNRLSMKQRLCLLLETVTQSMKQN